MHDIAASTDIALAHLSNVLRYLAPAFARHICSHGWEMWWHRYICDTVP